MKEFRIYAFLLALFSPVLAFIVALLGVQLFSGKNVFNLLVFIICLILSLINSSKLVEGDLVFYLEKFEMASHYNWLEYLFISFK